ncbi:uncharacterized protein LOC111388067 [Olea europaea var. sylvestris]|uniref:uncharacterized protein LOC111388067 n=1 Tax=Olea europaea var. sylvestris TaxID=158386 RepID=UPI000C1D8AF6|nr:uncharacterized protein LOC111388067 [Olea europaea var. sylvestris]
MGILEAKLGDQKLNRVMQNKFDGFMQVNDFCTHRAGRILILWSPSKVKLEVLETTPQIIHFIATCKVTSYTFLVSFVYGFHTIVSRRPLWNNIMDLHANVSLPWMILGDFNNVLKFDKNSNGAEVTPYEIKDFANCCLRVGLTDVRSIGCLYTWIDNSTWSKIDKVMVNDIWVQNGAYVFPDLLPFRCLFDHSPCIVSIHDRMVNTRKSFKFFNRWTNHEDFNDIILASWNFNVVGTKKLILCKKSCKLKGALNELNVKHFDTFLLGNTRRNFIATTLKEDVMYTTSQDQVALEFVLLGKKEPVGLIDMDIIRNGPLVSLEQGISLIRDISCYEIKEALFGIGDDKSHGPNGYTYVFSKRHGGTIEHDFVEAIMEFFSSGSILKQINHAVIALVPKSRHAPSVGDYRPISCYNVIYKVITKILASRLRPIWGDIVDQAQPAFIEGRSMMKNIHLAQ